MSSPFGMYGGFQYESPESRALGSITVESYEKVYDDQGKFMSKLAGDVSYLGSAMRKAQAGVDQANENAIQQFQDMINDVIVLLGGGGDTGFDFGDLRYVIIAIGALFGFTDDNGNIQVPLNLFQAAWHFFNNYILPVDNFQDAINEIVDNFIATMLDVLGEVPILGQAAQQLAVIISDIRDILMPIANAVQAFFEAFSIDINTGTSGISGLFGPFAPIVDALMTALDGVNLPDFSAVFHQIALWTEPFVQDIASVIEWFATLIHTVINLPFGSSTVADLIPQVISGLAPIMDAITAVVNTLSPLLGGIQTVVSMFGGGSVPAGTITNAQPELLIEPLFGPDSIQENPYWTVDMSSSRTDDGTGSAMVVANGVPHALRSGANFDDYIPVGATQELTAVIYVINHDYLGTGLNAAVELQIAPMTEDGPGDFVTIATYTPTGDILDWANAFEMTGTYTVPDGVIGVQLRIYISDDAQTGTFRFDDGHLARTGLIDPSNVTGLSAILQFIQNQVQAILDTVISVITGIPIIGGLISDLQNALANIASGNILGVFGGSTIGDDIQNLVDMLISGFTGRASSGGSVADLHTAVVQYTNIAVEDETHYFTTSGSIIVPAWATYADIIPLGPGQGGEQGKVFGLNGQPGAPGKFNPTTWELNTHYKAGDSINYTVPVGGNKNGGISTQTIVTTTNTTGTHTINAAPGNISQAGESWFGPVTGPGPGILDYNGQKYAGGQNQNLHGKDGVFPGGAGAGGNGDLFENGGAGAGAAVWIRFRANQVDNPSSGADQTPPSLPTSVTVTATNDTLNFVIIGSVDE